MWVKQLANSNHLSVQNGIYANISGRAVFDLSGKKPKRYFLEKRWATGKDILTAVMMNPSKAAHNKTDKTVDQLIRVAKKQRCHMLYVVNVSCFIDGKSSNLKNSQFAYDSINWSFIESAISRAKIVFLGWGLKGQSGILNQKRSNSLLLNVFKNAHNKIYCYEVLKSTDKKYAKNPYYVPHPRPLFKQEKYLNKPIRKITKSEFIKLFNS